MPGDPDDVMITDVDRKIIKQNVEDLDPDDNDDFFADQIYRPKLMNVYNMKKEIKLDLSNMGMKGLQDRVKKERREGIQGITLAYEHDQSMRQEEAKVYQCIKR